MGLRVADWWPWQQITDGFLGSRSMALGSSRWMNVAAARGTRSGSSRSRELAGLATQQQQITGGRTRESVFLLLECELGVV